MVYIRLLTFIFLVYHFANHEIRAFLPAPEMDVDNVLAARHFSKFIYQYAQHNGIHADAQYMGQRWPTYPFRLSNVDHETAHAGAIFRNGRKLIIAFRGSTTCFDWWQNIARHRQRNAACIGLSGHVHTGFSEILESVRPSLSAALLSASQDAGGSCEYVFTGHSLGGALSTLAAGSLSVNPDGTIFPNGLLENQFKVVNFSSPNVGDSIFNSHLERSIQKHNLLCFANEADVVPYVPPSAGNWYSRTGIWLCIRPEEHILGIATDYARTFYPWNLNLMDLGWKAAEIVVNIAVVCKLPTIAPATTAGQTFIKMHAVPEENLVKRKFLEMHSLARCLENYETLPMLVERESTANLIKSIF